MSPPSLSNLAANKLVSYDINRPPSQQICYPGRGKLDLVSGGIVFDGMHRATGYQDGHNLLTKMDLSKGSYIQELKLKDVKMTGELASTLQKYNLSSVEIDGVNETESSMDLLEFLRSFCNPWTRSLLTKLRILGTASVRFNLDLSEIWSYFTTLSSLEFHGILMNTRPVVMETEATLEHLDIRKSSLQKIRNFNGLQNLKTLCIQEEVFSRENYNAVEIFANFKKLKELTIARKGRNQNYLHLLMDDNNALQFPRLTLLDVSGTNCTNDDVEKLVKRHPSIRTVILIDTRFEGSTHPDVDVWTQESASQILKSLPYYSSRNREDMVVNCLDHLRGDLFSEAATTPLLGVFLKTLEQVLTEDMCYAEVNESIAMCCTRIIEYKNIHEDQEQLYYFRRILRFLLDFFEKSTILIENSEYEEEHSFFRQKLLTLIFACSFEELRFFPDQVAFLILKQSGARRLRDMDRRIGKEILEDILPLISVKGSMRIASNQTYVRNISEMWNPVGIGMIVHKLTKFNNPCRDIFNAQWTISREEIQMEPEWWLINLLEHFRNLIITPSGSRSLLKTRTVGVWNSVFVRHTKTKEWEKYSLQNQFSGRFLHFEQAYLHLSIFTIILLDGFFSDSINYYNDEIFGMFIDVSTSINYNQILSSTEVMEFDGVETFVLRCIESNLDGLISVGLWTLELILLKSSGSKKQYESLAFKMWFLHLGGNSPVDDYAGEILDLLNI